MNPEKLRFLINTAFAQPRSRLHHGTILVPVEPLNLHELSKSAVETEEDEDTLSWCGPEAIFEEAGFRQEDLFSFRWQSLGPMVWTYGLNALHIDEDRALVCVTGDIEPEARAIALVKGPSEPAVMSAFFTAFIDQNGAAFGVGPFGSLPSDTYNRIESLIPEKVVRAAYWKWMEWAENALGVSWEGLAAEISACAESPTTYPLELLKTLLSGFQGDAVAWLAEQQSRNDQLTTRAKQAIFDAYFKQSYCG